MFNESLPNAKYVFADQNGCYKNVYGDKAILEKSEITNKIENLNSQIRDKISYLVRKSKAHSKSFQWLNYSLSIFFFNKNFSPS